MKSILLKKTCILFLLLAVFLCIFAHAETDVGYGADTNENITLPGGNITIPGSGYGSRIGSGADIGAGSNGTGGNITIGCGTITGIGGNTDLPAVSGAHAIPETGDGIHPALWLCIIAFSGAALFYIKKRFA